MKKNLFALARVWPAALMLMALMVCFNHEAYAGPYQLQLKGRANGVYLIEASPDLRHWTVIATNQANAAGRLNFNDSRPHATTQRYYRGQLLTSLPQAMIHAASNPAKILVKPKAGVTLATLSGLNLSLGVSALHVFPKMGNLQIIKVPSGKTASALISAYQASGVVQYAEPDFYVQALKTPNDFYYTQGNLWNLNNTGQNSGTPGADIHAPAAWDMITTASNVIVAVVDTGVRYTHEDLAANMWVNPADGSHGTNTVTGSTDPNDDYGHGTHVSGTIGAVGDNTVGIVGVCWNVKIMALKFLDSSGNGTISDAILCLDYARDHGAKVVNASWGSPSFTSQALHDAIANLRDADIIFVAAAGNSAVDNDTTGFYPADYRDLDNVVAVAATDRNDQLASFSDYGVTNVDLAAPGTPIYSCWNGSDSDYEYDDGTSMSAATVSGAVALLRGYYPNDTHRQIINRMLNGVDLLPSLAGKTITGGRLDVAKALNASSPPPVLTANFSANPTSGQAPLAVQFTDTSSGSPNSWSWSFGDGTTSTTQNPAHTFSSAGTFTVSLTIGDGTGQTSSTSRTITATNASVGTSLTASFSANPTSGQAPLSVQFTDTSTGNPVAWNWNFGDGSTSTTQNPGHAFNNAGSYTVTLSVSDSSGNTSSASSVITATNSAPPPAVTANFSANPGSGQAPLTVQFTDQSSGPVTGWNWNFGDGATSTTQSPNHVYSSAGNYTATLTVSGNAGQTSSVSHGITVTNAPPPPTVTANFASNPSSGQAPLTVQFTDQSSGPVTGWNWNFGDSTTSTTQSPNHVYNNAGNYTATLTVTGSSGQTSSTSQTITVTNAPPPPTVTANFSANPSSGQAPLTVQFTDQSSGPVTGWNWNFGDGATSTTQSPNHVYSSAGNYTATLTVTGSAGQTSNASHTITVTNAPTTGPTVTVVATDPLASILSPGVFTITRSGNINTPLTVYYSLGGTARNGTDYQSLGGIAIIPARASSTTVVVQPKGLLTVLKTVNLTLSPDSTYNVGSPGSDTVTIVVEAGGL